MFIAPLKASHSITKMFYTTKHYVTKYRNLLTPNIHQKGKQSYTQSDKRTLRIILKIGIKKELHPNRDLLVEPKLSRGA